MAAQKKHPSTRARRNKAATAATLYEIEPAEAPIPELPAVRDGAGVELVWHDMTVAWWEDIWASPMSAEYHESDIHQLYLLARLMNDFWEAPTTAKAAEIRLQRQAFGLTPYDRRRLEWTIETAEEAKDRGESRRAVQNTAQQPDKKDDPRLALVT